MTLVIAPAGFGKSLLLQDWMAGHDGAPIAWLAMDHRDNDGRRLAERLVTSLELIDEHIGSLAYQRADMSGASLGEHFIAQLLSDIELSNPGVLVMDGVENITEPKVQRDVLSLIDHAPATLSIVLATRRDPDYRWFEEPAHQFRQEDLSFRADEAALLLGQLSGRELSARQVEAVMERAEGWAAGIQMFGLALRRGADVDELVAGLTGADRMVGDYLTEAVLDRQPEPVRRFLFQTSVLQKLSPDLCRAVTGDEDAPQLLRTLEQQSLFLIPTTRVDETGPWFRYQPLFREHARKALLIHQPETESSLLLSAAEWHLAHGDPEIAVDYLMEARAWERVIDLILEMAKSAYEQGKAPMLLNWLSQIPEVVRQAEPEALLIEAILLTIVGDTIQAEGRVDALIESRSPTTEQMALINMLRALWVQSHGGAQDAIDASDAVLAELERSPHSNYVDPFGLTSADHLRDMALVTRARAYWYLGDAKTSRGEFQSFLDSPVGYPAWRINAFGALGMLELWSGHLRDAYRWAAQALVVSSRSGFSGHPSSVDALLAMASLSLERSQFGRAEMLLEQALALADGVKRWMNLAVHAVERAGLDLAMGDPHGGLERLLRFANSGHPDLHPMVATRFTAAEARLRLAAGDNGGASRVLDSFPGPLTGGLRLLRVRICVDAGDLGAARQILDDWRAENVLSRIEYDLGAAIVEAAAGAELPAQQHLVSALARAEPEGYLRLFHDSGLDPRLLRRRALDAPSPYLERVLAHSAADVGEPDGDGRLSLSPRELTVLSYLPTRLSNTELAAELYISQNTVKSHLHSIYRQLRVTGRRDAVVEAERQGLL